MFYISRQLVLAGGSLLFPKRKSRCHKWKSSFCSRDFHEKFFERSQKIYLNSPLRAFFELFDYRRRENPKYLHISISHIRKMKISQTQSRWIQINNDDDVDNAYLKFSRKDENGIYGKLWIKTWIEWKFVWRLKSLVSKKRGGILRTFLIEQNCLWKLNQIDWKLHFCKKNFRF